MKTIEGTWSDTRGNLAAWGKLHLFLNQDAHVLATSQVAPRSMTFQLDQNGALMKGSKVWGNDELSPAGTYYTASVTANGGGVIWGPQWIIISGSDPVDLTHITPLRVIPPVDQFSSSATIIPSMVAGLIDSPVTSELGTTQNALVTVSNQLVLAPGANISLFGSASQHSMTVSIAGPAMPPPTPAFSAGIGGGFALGDSGPVSNQLMLFGGSNVTLSGSTDQAGMSLTLLGAAGGGTGGGGPAFSLGALGQTATNQVALIAGNNATLRTATDAWGMSVYIDAESSLSQSVQPRFTAGVGNVGTAGAGSTVTNQLLIAGGNNITISRTTNASGMTISVVGASQSAAPAFSAALSPGFIGQSGPVTNRLYLAGGNNITLAGTTNASGMTVTIEGEPEGTVGGGAPPFGAGLGGGNVSGHLGPVENRLYLAGGSNITLSGSTSGGSMTISVSGASQSSQTFPATSHISQLLVLTQGANVGLTRGTNVSGMTYTISAPAGGGGGANFTGGVWHADGALVTNSQGIILHGERDIELHTYDEEINGSTLLGVGLDVIAGGVTGGGQPFFAGISGFETGTGFHSGSTSGHPGPVSNQLRLAAGSYILLSGATNTAGMTVTVRGRQPMNIGVFSGGVGSTAGDGLGAGGAGLTGGFRLVAGSNVTLSGSTNPSSALTVTINAGGGGGGGGAVSFIQGSNITIGATQDAAGTTASFDAGGGGGQFLAGMSGFETGTGFHSGSTSGHAGPVSNRLQLAAGSYMFLSGNTNASGMTVTIRGNRPIPIALSGGGAGVITGDTAGPGNAGMTGGFRIAAGSNVTISGLTNAASMMTITINAGGGESVEQGFPFGAAIPTGAHPGGSTAGVGTSSGGTHIGLTGGVRFYAGSNITLSGSTSTNGVLSVSIHGAPSGAAAADNRYLAHAMPMMPFYTTVGQMAPGTTGATFWPFQPQVVNSHMNSVIWFMDFDMTGAGSHTLDFSLGIYTRTGSTLTRMSSSYTHYRWTYSTAQRSNFQGIQMIKMPITNMSFDLRDYWFGLSMSQGTSGQSYGVSGIIAQIMSGDMFGELGVTSTAHTFQRMPGWGRYQSSGALPASVAFSQLSGTVATGIRAPVMYLAGFTA